MFDFLGLLGDALWVRSFFPFSGEPKKREPLKPDDIYSMLFLAATVAIVVGLFFLVRAGIHWVESQHLV
jgi:hypothetical protein